MDLVPIQPPGVAINVSLRKVCIEAIWPGLNHLMCAYLMRQRGVEPRTSYCFAIHPLEPDVDSGTFSQAMMNRIGWLWAKLREKEGSGGRFELDAFQLRAAAFAARITPKVRQLASEEGPKGSAKATRAKQKPDQQTQRVIKFLEREMKRATRKFISEAGKPDFDARAREWESHLLWMKYRLAYFKPYGALIPSPGTQQRQFVERLVQMAQTAICARKYEPPHPAALRRAIRLFLNYSRRGRLGHHHHIYMLQHSDDPCAQGELFAFVERRVFSEGGDQMNRTPRQTAHRKAAHDPEVRELIQKTKRLWKHAPSEYRRTVVSQLIKKGCSTRGIAEAIGVSATTVRNYSKPPCELNRNPPAPPKTQSPKAAVRRVPSPIGGSPTRDTGPKPGFLNTPPPTRVPSADKAREPHPTQERSDDSAEETSMSLSLRPRPFPHPERSRGSTPPNHFDTSQRTQSGGTASAYPGEESTGLRLDPKPEPQEEMSSLQRRLDQIVIEFINTICGLAGTSSDPQRISEILSTARLLIVPGRQGFRTVQLPQTMTRRQLFEITEPGSRQQYEDDTRYLAVWLSTILNSLNPGDLARSRAIEDAEAHLLPQAEKKEDSITARTSRPPQIAHVSWREKMRSFREEA